jgi:hypothetical protein
VKAVKQLRTQQVALLGWEGVIFGADGHVAVSPGVRGTVSIDREIDEDWDAYVMRSTEFCLQTMQKEHDQFAASPDVSLGELFFCVVPVD